MPRQSITFTSPNDAWLKAQVDNQEYSNKSEVINDLIRKARREQEELEIIRAKLIQAEKSGTSHRSPRQIRDDVKQRFKKNG